MGTGQSINRQRLTPYQSIEHFNRGLKVYSTVDINRLEPLLEAMRTWNLHGSADKIVNWQADMRAYQMDEYYAEPFGIWDWDDMEDSFNELRD